MYINPMMLRLLFIAFIFFLKINYLSAEIVNDFKVKGNDRVSSETIYIFSKIKKGDDITDNDLNDALKRLYKTNFFEDVKLNFENKILTIEVKEYPVVQQIIVNGIKRQKTVEEIKEQVSLKEKNPFRKSLIKNDLNTILNIFKQSGFYFAEVDVEINDNLNNTVDLIYNVNRGEKATISQIKFIGDKNLKIESYVV